MHKKSLIFLVLLSFFQIKSFGAKAHKKSPEVLNPKTHQKTTTEKQKKKTARKSTKDKSLTQKAVGFETVKLKKFQGKKNDLSFDFPKNKKYTIQVASYKDERDAVYHSVSLKSQGYTAFYRKATVKKRFGTECL